MYALIADGFSYLRSQSGLSLLCDRPANPPWRCDAGVSYAA